MKLRLRNSSTLDFSSKTFQHVGISDYDKHLETALAALSNLSISMTAMQAAAVLDHVQVCVCGTCPCAHALACI